MLDTVYLVALLIYPLINMYIVYYIKEASKGTRNGQLLCFFMSSFMLTYLVNAFLKLGSVLNHNR
jgi:hypothetical protein